MARTHHRRAPQNSPDPLDTRALFLGKIEARRAIGRATLDHASVLKKLALRIKYVLAWIQAFRPVRVFALYNQRHGPLMAAGCAYNMFFSVAAMLVAGFSIFGLIASGNKELQQVIVKGIAASTPGLIDLGDGKGGLAKPDQLFGMSHGLSIALIISLATLLLTSLGWISGLREGVRGIFGVPPARGNPLWLKLRDTVVLLLLAVALMLTSVVAAAATSGLGVLENLLGLSRPMAVFVASGVTPLFLLVLDMVTAVLIFRGASMVSMPKPVLWQAAFIAGVGSTVLRMLSGLLLHGAGRNPLLAPFAVVIGLFIWFYFLSQVYLLAAAWGAVGTADSAEEPGRRRSRGLRYRRAKA